MQTQEIGTRGETEMAEKGGMVVREIDGGWGPIGLVLAHAGTTGIPGSHIDT